MGERKDLRDLLRDADFKQKRIIDDLASSSEESFVEERGLARDLKSSEGGDFIKSLFVGLLLIGIVVGSFWISFLVGKKVLVPPVKNLPTFEIPVPKPLTQADVEKAEPVAADVPEIKEREITGTPAVKKTTVAKTAIAPAAVKPTATASKTIKYYKVIAGTYSTSAQAAKMVNALKLKGFPSFVKKTTASYRVQAGAFDTKDKAGALVSRLKAKGFTPAIILQ